MMKKATKIKKWIKKAGKVVEEIGYKAEEILLYGTFGLALIFSAIFLIKAILRELGII